MQTILLFRYIQIFSFWCEEMKFDTVFDMELVENMNDFITAKLEDDDGPEIS